MPLGVGLGEPLLWKGLTVLKLRVLETLAILWVSGSLGRVKELTRTGDGSKFLGRTRLLPGPVSSEGSGAVRGPVIWACACGVVSRELSSTL